MLFISIIAIVIYFIGLAWTWKSLGFIEKNKKVAVLTIGIIVMYIITLIIFQTTKNDITYQNAQMQKDVQNILVIIFTGINNIIVMPQVGKIIDKISEDEIQNNELKKRIIILAIIFVICVIFECGYFKDMQEGILEIYRSNANV